MAFTQFRWDWSGWQGAPGVTLLRCRDNLDDTQTSAAAAAQATMWTAIKGFLPTGVTLTCQPTVSVINDGDGGLVEQRNISAMPAAVVGSGTGSWAAVSGFCIIWKTGTSTGRRLLMGRTFIVPAANATFDNTGKVSPSSRTSILTAAGTYVARVSVGTPGRPVAWHRPKPGVAGYSADITSVQLNQLGAELTRRRD